MSVNDIYQQKRTTPNEAIGLVRNGDFIIVPTGVGEPPTLLTALSGARRSFRDVKVGQILALRKYGYIDPETVEHVRHVEVIEVAPESAQIVRHSNVRRELVQQIRLHAHVGHERVA